MRRLLVFFCLLLGASPALADVTGRYRNGDEFLTIEGNGAGLIRVSPEARSDYTLFNGEDGFVVSAEPSGPVVMRWSDLIAALDAQMAELTGSHRETAPTNGATSAQWQAAGPAVVEGRQGVEYRPPGETMPEGQKVVLSEDPRLAALGLAWSRALTRMPSIGRLFGPGVSPAVQALSEMLAHRAPLQLGPIRLVDASFEAIAAGRFALPTTPLTREQVAERLRPRLVTPPPESAH